MYLRRYAKRTIEAYLKWTAAFIRFNNMRHPTATGYGDIELTQKHPQNKPMGKLANFIGQLSMNASQQTWLAFKYKTDY
ncbi:phage integrase N-terminal SAM-like domain-containing protein [Pseudoalteromonas sp. McH1-42]|nr:phage integrase N-terminal SAM-like domain-containing protein [Pseudoalteromonas sp. McH1-42]MCG7560835.1 phage integrase N-terminal SAM-like domain-containing protein [Pseudoalteromonas sp. McH1-42]